MQTVTALDVKKLDEMYLDWFNNFLTVARFAEYYGISVSDAEWVIDRGRKLNGLKEN